MTTLVSEKEDENLVSTNTCNYCHKTYSSKSNLKAHQQRTKKCIDVRTNTILLKELIFSKEQKLDEKIIERSENSPLNIYRTLTNLDVSGCKDCTRINSQLSSIMALNNKMFCQMIDMSNQISKLSIVLNDLRK